MEEKIKEILRKTEIIIINSGINEDFKQVAFKEVFRALFISDKYPKSESAHKFQEDIKKEKVLKVRSRNGPAKLIDELIEKNFFIQKRKDTDCINEINLSKGIKIPRKHMATILVRKLRSGKLKRERTKDGYVYFIE